MTRLTETDIRPIDGEFLALYDRRLQESTGLTLFGLACRAAGLGEAASRRLVAETAAAVVPMDCGQGLIPGFSESVRAILAHLGCATRITEHGEVAGLVEAIEGRHDLVFTADDYRFVVLDLRRRRVVDNVGATARGFVAALECLAGRYSIPGRPRSGDLRPPPSASPLRGPGGVLRAEGPREGGEGPREEGEGPREEGEGPREGGGGLEDREVLVIGCGEVGSAGCLRLLERGARVALYDIKAERARALAATAEAIAPGRVVVAPDLAGALSRHRLLFEASPAAGTVPLEALHSGSLVAAPGVPLGVTPKAAAALGGRLIHDPLQTGVATMLMEALRP